MVISSFLAFSFKRRPFRDPPPPSIAFARPFFFLPAKPTFCVRNSGIPACFRSFVARLLSLFRQSLIPRSLLTHPSRESSARTVFAPISNRWPYSDFSLAWSSHVLTLELLCTCCCRGQVRVLLTTKDKVSLGKTFDEPLRILSLAAAQHPVLSVMLFSILIAVVGTALVSAHTVMVYPGWRGDNLITNATFPYGMQWMYPCKYTARAISSRPYSHSLFSTRKMRLP